MSIATILILLAVISFALATFGVPAKINLTALGLMLLTLAQLIGA